MYKTILSVFALTICISTCTFAQNPDFCKQIAALKTLVEKEHYAPKAIDDSLSLGVFKIFVNSLDSRKYLFTKYDFNAFEKDSLALDDYIRNGDCNFIQKYTNRLRNRIVTSKSYLRSFSEVELDYSGKDTLYFDVDYDHKYFKDNEDAKLYWAKRVRYKVLTRHIEDTTDLAVLLSNFKSKAPDLKQKVIEKELCKLNELLNTHGGLSAFVYQAFLNAYLNYQDPHSSFFSTPEKNMFDHALGNNHLSFGITTDKNDNADIVISHIAPGSPAAKDKTIDLNDIIVSIASNETTLETHCLSNEDVLEFINNEARQKATFKIRKPNGLTKIVKLKKALIENEDNSTRGYVINDSLSSSTVGYIKIPLFYTNLELRRGLGMANDVAKEIYKLKKDNVEGLIIDLRFNGGGSLKEAMDLSGMFIDRGPVTIMKYNNGETYTLRDSKRGAVFTAPVVVLVNYFSASASELFASVMQDYSRAIIVGTPTFGKSSAQVILPLNEKENEDLGFAKLTIERFYSPTGKSHQSRGVIPDILLPSLYDDFETQEEFLGYALPNDSVEASFSFKKYKDFDITFLREKSKKRVKHNPIYGMISSTNEGVLKHFINKKVKYPLTLKNVFLDVSAYNKLWNDFNNMPPPNNNAFKVINTKATQKLMDYNPKLNEDNILVIEDMVKDPTIREAYNILNDILALNNN